MTVLVGARDRERGEAAVASLRASSPDVYLVILDLADDASIARAAGTWRRGSGGSTCW